MHQAPLSFLKNAICVRKNVLYLCSIMKLCVCRAGGGVCLFVFNVEMH